MPRTRSRNHRIGGWLLAGPRCWSDLEPKRARSLSPHGRHSMHDSPGFTRRRFLGIAAASVAVGPLGLLVPDRRLNAMVEAGVAQQGTAIRPFQVGFPEAGLTDLRKRINATKWPEPET